MTITEDFIELELCEDGIPILPPRYGTTRRHYRETDGGICVKIFEKVIGSKVMPHQKHIFEVNGEILTDEECIQYGVPSGTYAYRESGLSIMRQTGKTVIDLAEMVKTAVQGKRRRILYTAQTGKDSREKLIEDFWPMVEDSEIMDYVKRCYQGVGSEKIVFKNGSFISIGNSTETSLHGKTLYKAILDEIFADVDFRREQAVDPAMMTISQAQMLWSSAAGTEKSIYLRHKIKEGRKAAMADKGYGTAYFEWSADRKELSYDEEMWKRTHPALGRTVTLAAMRHAAEKLPEAEFRRAWLNIPTTSEDDGAIPVESWKKVCYPAILTTGRDRTWVVECAFDRSYGCIALYCKDTNTLELIQYQEGTDWVNAKMDELKAEHGGRVVYVGNGPAATLADTTWNEITQSELSEACAELFDAIISNQVIILHNPILDEVVDGAQIQPSGGRWVWDRKKSVSDVSPLIALSVAFAYDGEEELIFPFVIY